jgi:dCMP deaminase
MKRSANGSSPQKSDKKVPTTTVDGLSNTPLLSMNVHNDIIEIDGFKYRRVESDEEQCKRVLQASIRDQDANVNLSLNVASNSSSSTTATATGTAATEGVELSSSMATTPFAFVSVKKRENALSWDDYFMSVAFLSSMRSKDPSTQVGACIVNTQKRIVGIGYNGFPAGCSDDMLPWARNTENGNELDTKYPYVCHAELNAILNKNSADVQGCSLYVGLFPCNECTKMIIQSGIREVVYLSDKYRHTNSMIASRRMLNMSKVKTRQHVPIQKQIVIDFPHVDVDVS